jgi:hypothetical protein
VLFLEVLIGHRQCSSSGKLPAVKPLLLFRVRTRVLSGQDLLSREY